MTTNLQDQLWRAWACSVPLVAVTTADPEATQRLVTELAESKQRPAIRWDAATGFLPLNEPGDRVIQSKFPMPEIVDPLEALKQIKALPEFSVCVVYCLTPEPFFERPSVLQAAFNLRPLFSRSNRMAIFLCPPSLKLPAALQHDLLILDQPLPTESELQELVGKLYVDNGLPEPDEATLNKAGAILRGLGPFDSLQAASLAMTEHGLDIAALQSRKKQFVRNVRGLTISEEPFLFADIGGLQSVRLYNEQLFTGPEPPLVTVRIDEMEKLLAGTTGDLSGVSQDQLAVMLSAMEDYQWNGEMLVGLQGSGKSLISKAVANTFNVLGTVLDLGATKEGIVGSSEANIRTAMKTLYAMGGKRVLFLGTMNKLTEAIPPPLQRRFRARFYFDLPDAEERVAIWLLHLQKYHLTEQPSQALLDEPLSGSDVRDLVDTAWRLGCSLEEARQYIVPVALSDPEGLDQLRRSASRRLLSASRPGVYVYSGTEQASGMGDSKRKLQFH